MNPIFEVDQTGSLHLPATVLPVKEPNTRYSASIQGEQLVLSPVEGNEPFWKRASTQEWLASFNAWMASHQNGPGLSDEAVTRDSFYD